MLTYIYLIVYLLASLLTTLRIFNSPPPPQFIGPSMSDRRITRPHHDTRLCAAAGGFRVIRGKKLELNAITMKYFHQGHKDPLATK